jgi:tRNA dimethylallyltransferase
LADKQNHRRLLRGVEVHLATGLPISHFREGKNISRPFDSLKLIVDASREQLYANIHLRVDRMMEDGLLDECRSLLPFAQKNALQTVGYKELFAHLNGETDLQTAVDLIKQNTRRYAKRQLTWFRKESNAHWLPVDEIAELNEEKVASLQRRNT